MNTTVLQRLWEENKRFLLIAGGGLFVFLLARSCVISAYEERATDVPRGTIARNQALEREVSELLRSVREDFNRQRELLGEYEVIEKDVTDRFAIKVPENLVYSGDRKAKEVFFTERIDAIWGEVHPRARRINCELPEKISTRDLAMSPNDDEFVLRRHSTYLEVIRRALNAMVDAGVMRIERPSLEPEEAFAIKENPDYEIVFRRVGFRVRGTYESFLRVLRECQKPARYLHAVILDMDPRRAGPDAINGRIEFAGFTIERRLTAAGEAP